MPRTCSSHRSREQLRRHAATLETTVRARTAELAENTASWDVARTWTLSGTGRALAFAPEGSLLAVASDGEAAIWDADTGGRIVSFSTPGSAEMEEIAWSPNGDRVVTSADDGVLRFCNSDDGRLLASLYVLDSGGD